MKLESKYPKTLCTRMPKNKKFVLFEICQICTTSGSTHLKIYTYQIAYNNILILQIKTLHRIHIC